MKPDNFLIRMISAGAVIEEVNDPEKSFAGWKTVTKKKPTPKQLKQMHFAWKAISRIRSNTVAVIDAKVAMTRGIGSGQTSRVLATKIALERAGKYTRGAILASDSFFPFDDSVQLASKAGIAAIVQQGGSVRDSDSIKAADQAGIAMVFTGQRVFWH
jgi:phosphoribosylaminoimidazolecarboxamide formyltransferase/IMP cyclohydrolase